MKTKQILFYGLIVTMSFLLISCSFLWGSITGNGNVTEEVRQVREFDQIEVSRGMNVYITQGSPARVVVIADSNLHEVIQTTVQGGVLKVYTDENIKRADEKKVMITVEKLTEVSASMGSNVYSQNQLKARDLVLSASTGANLTMDLNVQNLEAECSTGSNVILSGQAREARLEGSTGSNLKGQELATGNCHMRATVGANVYASVAGSLEADASTGGNIIYYGAPAQTNIESSSGGNVHSR